MEHRAQQFAAGKLPAAAGRRAAGKPRPQADIAALETELSAMQARLASYDTSVRSNGGDCTAGCDTSGACDTCDTGCCRSARFCGWNAGVELLFLKPHFEDEAAFHVDRSHIDEIVAFDYDYNVAVTAKVAEAAHAVGASVEGELGVLGSLETG